MQLQSNKITGSIPSEIGNLVKFSSKFYLYDNRMCGTIPNQVATLSNQFSGTNWQVSVAVAVLSLSRLLAPPCHFPATSLPPPCASPSPHP